MGVVELVLEIQPSGAITQVAVVASSSHQILDDAAVETLRGLGRLPFPAGMRPRKLSVRVPVVYELR
jgi:TonB family protein